MPKSPAQIAQAREAARNRTTGEFGMQSHSAPDDADLFPTLDDESWLEDGEPTTAERLHDEVARAVEALADLNAGIPEQEAAIRDAGQAVAARAEEIAGITTAEVVAADQAARERAKAAIRDGEPNTRVRAARREYDEARAALEVARQGEDHGAEQQAFDRWNAASERFHAAADEKQATRSTALGASTPEREAHLRVLSDGYLQALAEVRDMSGQTENFTPSSQDRARSAFIEASAYFPKDWLDNSNAHGPVMARQRKERAHYAHFASDPASATTHHWDSWVTSGETVRILPEGETPSNLDLEMRAGRERNRNNIGSVWLNHAEFEPASDGGSARRVWKAVQAQAPRERKLRGLISAGGERPAGSGWQWIESPYSEGMGYWARPRASTISGQDIQPEIKTSASTPKMAEASATLATSIHELAHRAEYTATSAIPATHDGARLVARRGSIGEMEHAFLARRWQEAGVKTEAPRLLYPNRRGNTEVARDAGFVSPYVGKIYGEGYRPATEVLSMGSESVFAGSYGGLIGLGNDTADLDHRDFVLGMFAAFGHKQL